MKLEKKNIKELIIKDNPNGKKDKKRLIAFFLMKDGKTRQKKFGSYGSYSFSDGAEEKIRNNYIKRHSKLNEDWNDIFSAGSLSRYILWEFKSNNEIEKFYNRKFKIPVVKINFTRNKK